MQKARIELSTFGEFDGSCCKLSKDVDYGWVVRTAICTYEPPKLCTICVDPK